MRILNIGMPNARKLIYKFGNKGYFSFCPSPDSRVLLSCANESRVSCLMSMTNDSVRLGIPRVCNVLKTLFTEFLVDRAIDSRITWQTKIKMNKKRPSPKV
jgi:hypothetical protein